MAILHDEEYQEEHIETVVKLLPRYTDNLKEAAREYGRHKLRIQLVALVALTALAAAFPLYSPFFTGSESSVYYITAAPVLGGSWLIVFLSSLARLRIQRYELRHASKRLALLMEHASRILDKSALSVSRNLTLELLLSDAEAAHDEAAASRRGWAQLFRIVERSPAMTITRRLISRDG